MTLDLTALESSVELTVLVQPRAPREEVGGTHSRALRVRVHAPPREGLANEAVRRALARALGARPGNVQILSGHRSRRKRVRIHGSPEELRLRLERLAEGPRPV